MKKIIILLFLVGVLIFAIAHKSLAYALGFDGNSLSQIQKYEGSGAMGSRYNEYRLYNRNTNRNTNRNFEFNYCIDDSLWGWGNR